MQLRLNEDEKEQLSRAAARQGLPVSSFVRMSALQRAQDVLAANRRAIGRSAARDGEGRGRRQPARRGR